NRAGALVHADPTGTKDVDLPAHTRVYTIASAPHGPGPFPPDSNSGGGMVGRAALNPLNYSPAVRALFRALDRWVAEDVAPIASARMIRGRRSKSAIAVETSTSGSTPPRRWISPRAASSCPRMSRTC